MFNFLEILPNLFVAADFFQRLLFYVYTYVVLCYFETSPPGELYIAISAVLQKTVLIDILPFHITRARSPPFLIRSLMLVNMNELRDTT